MPRQCYIYYILPLVALKYDMLRPGHHKQLPAAVQAREIITMFTTLPSEYNVCIRKLSVESIDY